MNIQKIKTELDRLELCQTALDNLELDPDVVVVNGVEISVEGAEHLQDSACSLLRHGKQQILSNLKSLGVVINH